MTEARGSADRNGETHARYTPGTPCWVSLMVHDLTAAQDFYRELFGWEFRPGPPQLGPSVRVLLDDREVGGIGRMPSGRGLPVAWTPHFASDDVDTTAETVRLCGGTVGVGPLDAAGAGRLAMASDPSGALFGIRRPPDHPGPAATGVPGTPAWIELVTYETAGVLTFYETVFGYKREPLSSPDLDYVTLHLAGHPVAGLRGAGGALDRDRGPHWMTYFEVADTDAALTRVTGLGGRPVTPSHDTAHGRVATAADPEGALFSLIRRPR
ncbi:VOC family protein [Streptomyces sp. MS06]|uniref:VOC family protein n=1 Tax=Streptomyces sp. MS06 TaxID=3385974 RepID=UPI0039A11B8E